MIPLAAALAIILSACAAEPVVAPRPGITSPPPTETERPARQAKPRPNPKATTEELDKLENMLDWMRKRIPDDAH